MYHHNNNPVGTRITVNSTVMAIILLAQSLFIQTFLRSSLTLVGSEGEPLTH